MGAVSLYDSEMEDGARLDALSLVMKGERLPRGTRGRAFGRPGAREATSFPACVLIVTGRMGQERRLSRLKMSFRIGPRKGL